MSQPNPEHRSRSESHENDILTFTDKFRDLLPGVEFDEPAEMLEARAAVLEALMRDSQNPDFLRSVWAEYANVCEQAVDNKAPGSAYPQTRAQLQVAALVHKALIFRESGDTQRYGEDLTDAEEYAFNAYLDEIAEIIRIELDTLRNEEASL